MEGWVDLVDLIAPRPGVEPATFQSQVQRRTAAPLLSDWDTDMIYQTQRNAEIRDLPGFEIRFKFESAVPIQFESDGPIQKFSNRPCLPIACRGQMTQTINGA